jgi:hypothetical protein
MSALQHSDSDALRALVREILRDLVPTARARTAATERPAAGSSAPRVESVSISSDVELQAFVRRLLDLSADPGGREALRSGRHGFRLADRGASPPAAAKPAMPETEGPERHGEERMDRGVLSESKVVGLARSGRRIVLGKRVVVTPLARDKARQLGVKLERET